MINPNDDGMWALPCFFSLTKSQTFTDHLPMALVPSNRRMIPTIFAIENSNPDLVIIHPFGDEAIDVTTLVLAVADEITYFHSTCSK